MTKSLLVVAAASALLAASAHAQKKPSPENTDSTFSSDSRLVLVDAVVTDRKGAYIGDLTQKDFRIREDGKPQTITSFSYETDAAQDDRKHYLVLLFDNPTVPQIDQHYAREAATKVIGLNAAPNRLMAVVEFGGTLKVTQNLTGDAERLKQAVNGAKPSVAAIGPLGPVAALNPAKLQLGGLTSALSHLAEGMVKLPGRKTIILFSEGLTGNPDLMKSAIEACNRANVAIYPVDVGALAANGAGFGGSASMGRPMGMYGPGAAQRAAVDDLSAPQSPSDALYGLAKATGGFVIPTPAKLSDDLSSIGKEEGQYYVLGYLPAKESQPGACHAIKVEMDRRGANVRARDSYCDVETPEIQTGTVTERDLEARLSANAAPTVHATMQTPFFYVAPNTARVDLALDIPGAEIKFAKDKGKFTAILNVIGIAYLPDNGVAARFNDTRKVTLDDRQQVDEFASRPYHFEKQFEMASGTFDLKVALSSGASGFGAIETSLTIDPWTPSKFLLSGLALSQSTRPASVSALGSEVDLFGDKVPLVVNGVQLIPAGTNRLVKSQKAYIYGEIYEPALAVADRMEDTGVVAQLSVFNAGTGQLAWDSGAIKLKPETAPGTPAAPLGMIIPTEALAPGSYSAQITVQDAAGDRSVRRIDFELTP